MPSITADPTEQLGKFVVIHGSPPSLPGNCFLCSTAKQNTRYIDPRRDLEWHGTVYLCEECVVEMAHNLGMLQAGESDALLADLKALTERNLELTSQVEDLEQTIDLLSQRRLSDRVTGGITPVDSGQDSLPSDDKSPSSNADGLEESKQGLNESSSEPGPYDIPNTDSDDGGVLNL